VFPAWLWGNPGDSQLLSKEINLQEYIEQLRAVSAALDGESLTAVREIRMSLPGEWHVQAGR